MTMNLISNIHIAGTRDRTPEVGMGVTVCYYSDRSAATVVAVRFKADGTVKEFDTRADKQTRTDTNGMSDAQSYDYAPGDADWPVQTWRYDNKGRLRKVAHHWDGGRRMLPPNGGPKLALGIRDAFYDYTF